MWSHARKIRASWKSMSRLVLPLSLLSLLLSLLLLDAVAQAKSTPESLNRYIEGVMADRHIPSVAALRLTDGGTTTQTGFWGYANVKRKEATTADTAYLCASVSKLFTATAIMQLKERGKLDLDDDVNEFLPDGFPKVRNPNFPGVPITIKQILTHTSSIRDEMDFIVGSYDFTGGVDPEISLQDFAKEYFEARSKTKAYRREHRPGSWYEYSNMAFTLLGVVVEETSGVSFEAFQRENIFGPLGMSPASFLIEGLLASGVHIAMPYRWSKRKQMYQPYGYYTLRGTPDGGLRASVDALAAFMKMILRTGLSDSGERVLKVSSVAEMMKRATSVEDWQGLAWYQTEVGGGVWGHGGADDGASTILLVDRRGGKALVVLTNVDDGTGEDEDYSMLDRLWDWE